MKSFHTLFVKETHVGLVRHCLLQTLHCLSRVKKECRLQGIFCFFFKVNPWTLLDLLVCVQPAPGKLWYAVVTSCPISSRPPQAPTSPCTGLLLRSRYIIFKYQKWWLDCSCQISGHFRLGATTHRHPLFSSHAAVSSFLSTLVAWRSLLTFRIYGSFLLLHCCLCLLCSHVTVTQGSVLFSLSSCLLPSFLFWICLPQVVSSLPMFNSMDMLMEYKIYNYSPYFCRDPCLRIQLPLWCS